MFVWREVMWMLDTNRKLFWSKKEIGIIVLRLSLSLLARRKVGSNTNISKLCCEYVAVGNSPIQNESHTVRLRKYF